MISTLSPDANGNDDRIPSRAVSASTIWVMRSRRRLVSPVVRAGKANPSMCEAITRLLPPYAGSAVPDNETGQEPHGL
jgi:hypothetical protein